MSFYERLKEFCNPRSDFANTLVEALDQIKEDIHTRETFEEFIERVNNNDQHRQPILDMVTKEHLLDLELYSFEAEKKGEFLVMHISRKFGPEDNVFSTVLPVRTCDIRKIPIVPGSCFTEDGGTAYAVEMDTEEGVLHKVYCYPMYSGRIIWRPEGLTETFISWDRSEESKYRKYQRLNGKFASLAISDQVHLLGTDTVLFVPYGRGDEVQGKIIDALTL